MLTITLTRNPRTDSKAVTGKITVPFDKFPLKENEQPYTGNTLENADFIIPAGTYPLDLTWSPKFKKLMPEVQDVPERTGIRIIRAPENFNFWEERRARETYRCDEVASQSEGFERDAEHSEGCILVDYMTLEAVKAFINRINKYTEDEEKIVIQITEP